MHVSVSGLRAQKSTFFGPGPALDFSRNGLRRTLPSRSDGKGIELLDQRCVDGAAAALIMCKKI